MIMVLELFGGYGSQALALENLGIEFKSDLCEIDKYAIQAYNQIHGETFNYGDICSIDETKLPYYDLITYSSPCQDFSQAGKQAGGEKGSGTRSSLLWECERIIRTVKPKYLLMENVKALTSKKFMPLFAKWLNTLEEIGYKNWWKVLNAKDYGVPQNRERVFVVSILGGGNYQFPDPIPLTKRLKDVLDQNVDEKYYLSDDKISRFKSNSGNVVVPEATKQGYANAYDGDSINLEQPNSQTRRGRVGHQMANTLTCSCNQGVVEPYNSMPDGTARTIKQQYHKNSTANFLRTDSFGATGVLESVALDEQNGYIRKDGCVGTLTTDGSSPKHNNRVIEPMAHDEQNKKIELNRIGGLYGQVTRWGVYDDKGLSPTLTASMGMGGGFVPMTKQEPKVRQVGNIVHTGNFDNPQRGRIYSSDGCCPALNTVQGGGLEPKVIVEGYFKYPNSDKKHQSNTIISKEGISTTLDTMGGGNLQPKIIDDTYSNRTAREYTDASPSIRAERSGFKVVDYRIRKLTPRECWRLMGVRDYQFDKLHDISNSQLYKMAGNSIVVDVLMGIFKNMFMPEEQERKGQLELF